MSTDLNCTNAVETNEARTFLDFTQDGDLSLNGTTRNETDANIRKQFGTIEVAKARNFKNANGTVINHYGERKVQVVSPF